MAAADYTTRELDKQRIWLAIALIAAFIGSLLFLLLRTIPLDNKDIIVYMLGQLSGMVSLALGAYFVNKIGQDAQDAKKSDNTGKLADAVVAAAAAGQANIVTDQKEAKPDADQ